MKMVAASKLRRAQEAVEAARPYAQRMERILSNLAIGAAGQGGVPAMLAGTNKNDIHMIIVMTANRGLCGGFNANIIRAARNLITEVDREGKGFKLYCVGRKGRDNLRRDYESRIVASFDEFGRKVTGFNEAEAVAEKITALFEVGEFDVCTIIYSSFKSAMLQKVTRQQIIPFPVVEAEAEAAKGEASLGHYEYEPSHTEILKTLVPHNLAIQILRALLENGASEQGARMTAMDNATRNAAEMIDDLTLTYNRTRQALITNELIEIISGAEAV